METAALLTKEQLAQILAEVPFGCIRRNANETPPIAYQKLGVLVDLDEIIEAKHSSAPKLSNNQVRLTQTYSCIECKRILPTAHLLDLHITEQHDMYFAASVERRDKPMYACYLEECPIKLHTPRERKDHCIIVHKFPPNYRFDQSKAKGQRAKNEQSMEVDIETKPPSMPYIKAFSFGHPAQRTFNTRRERPKPGTTLVDVQAMKDALNDITD